MASQRVEERRGTWRIWQPSSVAFAQVLQLTLNFIDQILVTANLLFNISLRSSVGLIANGEATSTRFLLKSLQTH